MKPAKAATSSDCIASTSVSRSCGRSAAEHRDRRAEGDEDRDPQHHRAFMAAPDAGDLVDQRHQRVRVLVGERQRKSEVTKAWISAANAAATSRNCSTAACRT